MKNNQRYWIGIVIWICSSGLCHSQAPIEAVLTVPGDVTAPFFAGESIPLTLQIWNRSDKALYVLPPLDGSTVGIRYPAYEVQVDKPIPHPDFHPGFICGTVNLLQEEAISCRKRCFTPTRRKHGIVLFFLFSLGRWGTSHCV